MTHGDRSNGRFRGDDPSARKSSEPRRVRQGVRLRNRGGIIPHTALSRAFLELIETACSPAMMDEGLRYARLGQAVSLRFSAGLVEATIQGREPAPYAVRICMRSLSMIQWERVISDMAAEPICLVQLSTGEIPDALEGILARQDLALLPASLSSGDVSCSCTGGAPSKHVACTALLAAERLAEDPLLVLAVLGLPSEHVIDRLRQRRAMQVRGRVLAHYEPLLPESSETLQPLEDLVHRYWDVRVAPGDEDLPQQHAPPDHALLRRLGPSSLQGRFPLVGLLASIYDSVSQAAVEIERYADDTGRQS